MQFSAVISGAKGTATVDGSMQSTMLDSGAEENFLSHEFAVRNHIGIKPCKLTVNMADGSSQMKVTGTADVHVSIGQYGGKVRCIVVDLPSDFDLILGEPWLKKHKAELRYATSTVVLRKGKRKIKLSAVPKEKPPRKSLPLLARFLSAIQVKRALKNRERVFLVHLTKIEDGGLQIYQHNLDPEGLTEEYLEKYKDVFPGDLPKGLPPKRKVVHTIPTQEGVAPPARPMYRLSPLEYEEMKRTVQELLDKGYIEPSCSPYAAPILFVAKKDSSLRMVCDFRALNKQTIKSKWPMARADDLFDKLSGATVFSALDLASGYHQVRIADEDVPKTAFRTPLGLVQWRVLPFGLSNAPATFSSVLAEVFGPAFSSFTCVYLDDILVFSKSVEEHTKHLKMVLDRLREYKLYAKLSKCSFFQKEVHFLGHVVRAGEIAMDPAKIQSVQNWPAPKDVHQLRSFLGLANYFRRFIKSFAHITAPLNELTHKEVQFNWSEQHDAAFNQVKVALTTAPCLALPDFEAARTDKPFVVTTDASDFGIGAILTQDNKPVAFESRKLTSFERTWTTTEKEMLGIIHALTTWRCYLEGLRFTVYTDHKPNETFADKPQLSSRRQGRWAQVLALFDCEIKYKPGTNNMADPLSRHPLLLSLLALRQSPRLAQQKAGSQALPLQHQQPVELLPTDAPQVPHLASDTIQGMCMAGYQKDPWFANVANTRALACRNGLWYKGTQIVVPDAETEGKQLRQHLISQYHDTLWSGHLGITKTLKALQIHFWWPRMNKQVTQYVRTCVSCQRNKPTNMLPAGLLQPLAIPNSKWESISMDFITCLPTTTQGNDAIVVFVDRLSKLVHLQPCKTTITAMEFASVFMWQVFRLHGMPREIVSDRDTRFVSEFWRNVCTMLGVQQSMSTAFHPQSDGQTERANRTLEEMLRHFVNPHQDDWDTKLATCEFAINSAHQESIGTSPFYLTYGCTPRTPLTVQMESQSTTASDWAQTVQETLALAKQALTDAQRRQKDYSNLSRRDVEYAVGDQVLLNTKHLSLKPAGSRKLWPRFIGPFAIVTRIGPVAYKLDLPPSMGKIHDVFHVSLLEKYNADGRHQPPPPHVEINNEVEYEVNAILAHRTRQYRNNAQRTEYLIDWKGYGPEHRTWEPEINLANAPALLTAYWEAMGEVTNYKPAKD
jgi:hypothetical protein